MDKVAKTLLLIGGGVASYAILRYAYKTISLAQKMEVGYEGFIIKSITPELSGVVTLYIKNVSDLTLTIKNVDVKLFAGNVEVGSLTQSQELSILPNKKSLLRLNININYDSVKEGFGQIKGIISDTGNLPIDVVGVLDLKSIFGWIKMPIKYSTTGKDLKALYDQYY